MPRTASSCPKGWGRHHPGVRRQEGPVPGQTQAYSNLRSWYRVVATRFRALPGTSLDERL
jgi:hypothetical protein